MSYYMCTGTSLLPLIPYDKMGKTPIKITSKYPHHHHPEPMRKISSVSMCVAAHVREPA